MIDIPKAVQMYHTQLMSLKMRRHAKPAPPFVINTSITPQPETTVLSGCEACKWRGRCGDGMGASQRNGSGTPVRSSDPTPAYLSKGNKLRVSRALRPMSLTIHSSPATDSVTVPADGWRAGKESRPWAGNRRAFGPTGKDTLSFIFNGRKATMLQVTCISAVRS